MIEGEARRWERRRQESAGGGQEAGGRRHERWQVRIVSRYWGGIDWKPLALAKGLEQRYWPEREESWQESELEVNASDWQRRGAWQKSHGLRISYTFCTHARRGGLPRYREEGRGGVGLSWGGTRWHCCCLLNCAQWMHLPVMQHAAYNRQERVRKRERERTDCVCVPWFISRLCRD